MITAYQDKSNAFSFYDPFNTCGVKKDFLITYYPKWKIFNPYIQQFSKQL